MRGGPLRGGPLRGGPLRGGPLRGGPLRGGPLRGGPLRGGPLRGAGATAGRPTARRSTARRPTAGRSTAGRSTAGRPAARRSTARAAHCAAVHCAAVRCAAVHCAAVHCAAAHCAAVHCAAAHCAAAHCAAVHCAAARAVGRPPVRTNGRPGRAPGTRTRPRPRGPSRRTPCRALGGGPSRQAAHRPRMQRALHAHRDVQARVALRRRLLHHRRRGQRRRLARQELDQRGAHARSRLVAQQPAGQVRAEQAVQHLEVHEVRLGARADVAAHRQPRQLAPRPARERLERAPVEVLRLRRVAPQVPRVDVVRQHPARDERDAGRAGVDRLPQRPAPGAVGGGRPLPQRDGHHRVEPPRGQEVQRHRHAAVHPARRRGRAHAGRLRRGDDRRRQLRLAVAVVAHLDAEAVVVGERAVAARRVHQERARRLPARAQRDDDLRPLGLERLRRGRVGLEHLRAVAAALVHQQRRDVRREQDARDQHGVPAPPARAAASSAAGTGNTTRSSTSRNGSTR